MGSSNGDQVNVNLIKLTFHQVRTGVSVLRELRRGRELEFYPFYIYPDGWDEKKACAAKPKDMVRHVACEAGKPKVQV